MKVNPQSFFNFCANHAALLRGLAERGGEISEAEAMRLIRANPSAVEELPETAWRRLRELQILVPSEPGSKLYFMADPVSRLLTYLYNEANPATPEIIRGYVMSLETTGKQLGRALDEEDVQRVAGVGRFRNTKATENSEDEIISVRVWRDDALLKNGKSVAAATATTTHGVFSFLLTQKYPYELRGSCALVENPALFAVAEQLNLGVGLIIYGHGRISNRALDWLARMTDSSFNLLHLPDYDPVGLSEFQRLHARLGKRVVLHLPADLEARFAKFSNRELLKKGNSQTMLAQLRRSDLLPIRRVVELIDRYNAGLEQEALLINPS